MPSASLATIADDLAEVANELAYHAGGQPHLEELAGRLGRIHAAILDQADDLT